MARSLTEGMDAPKASGKKAGGKGGDTGKLVFALVLLAIAGGVFAWSQGWILAGADKGPQITAEERAVQQKSFEEQKQHTEQQIKSGKAQVGGSS